MADLPSILGGMAQGFMDFGKGAVDLFGTGGAAIGDLIESARTGKVTTKSQDDFRKWLYNTDSVKDATAKGLGTTLNGVQTVLDYIPGVNALTRNPLGNAAQGALGGLADEFKTYGENYDLGRAGQRAAVSGAAAAASGSLADALKGSSNALLSSNTVQGLARGATGGAITGGGYAAIDGGDVLEAAKQGAGMGALIGGATGAFQDFKPAKTYDVALSPAERQARIENAQARIDDIGPVSRFSSNPDDIAKRAMITELQDAIKAYQSGFDTVDGYKTAMASKKANRPETTTGISEEQQVQDYMMTHRPTQTGIYADNLLAEGADGMAYPKDVYDNPQYYTFMYDDTPNVLNETMAQLNAVRGNPNGEITIYRATPGNTINDGDWITLSKTYADLHNQQQLGGKGNVLSQKVNVRDVQPSLDDLAEWGYYPQRKSLDATLADADMAVNSPRYLTDENGNPRTFYHGSPNKNITEFDINQAGRNTSSGERALYFTDSPEVADEFSYERIPSDSMFVNNRGAKGRVYPVNLEMNNPLDLDNLTDAQIRELWQYASPLGQLDGQEKFIKNLTEFRDAAHNGQLTKTLLDLDKLANSQYDGFTARMYPNQDNQAREYAVFDNSKVKMLEDVLANDDAAVNDVMESRIATGQLGLFDDTPTQTPKTGTRQTSLFDQPQEGVDYYGSDIEMPIPENGLISRDIEDLTQAPIDVDTLPKGWLKARELADMGKRAKQIVLDPNAPNRGLNEYNMALYSDAQYGRNNPVADIIDRLGSRQLSNEIDRGAARLLADQLDESGDKFAKNFVTGAAEVGGNIGHYKDAPKASLADQRVSELLNIGRSTSMLSDSLAKPTSRNALGDQWKGTINIKGNNLSSGGDDASSVLWHERMHAFQDAEKMGYDKRVVDAYNDLREDLAKLQHDNKQILRDHGEDAKYWGKPIEQEARMAQHYLDSNYGVDNLSKVYARDSKGKIIRVDDNGQELDPNNLHYYTGKPVKKTEYAAEDKQIKAAFDKFIGKLQKLSRQGVALPALAALFGGGAYMASQDKDKEAK